MNYQVIVGNIGSTYQGNNKVIAFETYKEYVLQSKTAHMRTSGETVVLLVNGELEKEHVGSLALEGQE